MLRFIPIFIFALLSPALAMGAVPDEPAFRAAQAHNGRSIGPRVHVAANTTTGKSVSVPVPEPRPAKAGQLTTTQVQQNPILLLQSFSTSDLNAAIALANAQTPPDTTAATCYQAILTMLQNINGPAQPTGQVGAFYLFQQARDAKAFALNILSPTGPASSLNTACAPLVLDAQATLVTMGVGVGLIANPVGGAATLAGLPAALAAFLAAMPK